MCVCEHGRDQSPCCVCNIWVSLCAAVCPFIFDGEGSYLIRGYVEQLAVLSGQTRWLFVKLNAWFGGSMHKDKKASELILAFLTD